MKTWFQNETGPEINLDEFFSSLTPIELKGYKKLDNESCAYL